MTDRDFPYRPDHVVPPGATLLETLAARGMTQAELSDRTARPRKTINEIINGKAPITAETALQLEHVLGVPASFWSSLEMNYREALARKAQMRALGATPEWVERLPWKAMVKLGWVPRCPDAASQAHALLDFFGVASPEAWDTVWTSPEAVFRKSMVHPTDVGSAAAWLRKGEIDAQRIRCAPYTPSAAKRATLEARALTVAGPEVFVPRLQDVCAAAGVAVVFVPEIPQCRISGAARWLAPDRAVVQLSMRFKTDDHLWFTFFHEIGHIQMHGKRAAFIDDGGSDGSKREREADQFAADLLVPPAVYGRLAAGQPSRADVLRAAADLGIAPGIVVGRLQHDGVISFSWFNDLKRRFEWSAAST